MLCTAIAASASEPLVQEGKTWKHTVYAGLVGHYPSSSEVSMRIGSAEEIHGKTYYPLRDVETNELYAYLRQEGNKVYSCMDICEEWGDINGESEEYLVYDFDAKPGEIYESISVADNVAVDLTGYCGSCFDKEKVTVLSVDNIMINGVERKRMIVEPEYGAGLDYEIIEGIGVNWGYVHLPEFGPFCTGITALVNISEVTDAKGNVLFTEADFDAPAYRPLVQEGKAWSQISYKWFEDYGRYGKIWLPEMYFKGKCERNGKEYSVLRTSPDDVWALMRQDGGKVYLLLDENFMSRYDFYDDFGQVADLSKYRDTEVLVYDFDAKKGDEFQGIYYRSVDNAFYLNTAMNVYGVDEISVNGQNLRRLNISYIGYIVEGYGAQNSNCLIPQLVDCMAGMHDYCDPELRMHHIIDRATREEIFTYEDFSKPSVGVEEIPAEQPKDGVQAKPHDNKMYDLNGREIRNPLPGTVYIQNGEKHVAK